jgi:hypothetical protein
MIFTWFESGNHGYFKFLLNFNLHGLDFELQVNACLDSKATFGLLMFLNDVHMCCSSFKKTEF